MYMSDVLMSVIFAGVLEHRPGIKLVIGEAGTGWIPYILQRMDAEWEDQFKELDLKMPPSEYWRRQCYATYQSDPIGVKLLDELGEDNIMWGSDFPHPGRHLAGLAGIHQARARPPARGDAAQDRLRQRRQALPLRQLVPDTDFITVAFLSTVAPAQAGAQGPAHHTGCLGWPFFTP